MNREMRGPVTQKESEDGAWGNIHGVWQRVYGSFHGEGCSIEWHEFRGEEPLDWARSFHPNSLEICLNFGGSASFGSGKTAQKLQPTQCAVYSTHLKRYRVQRLPGQIHRFLTLEMTPAFLRKELGQAMDGISPEFRDFCNGKNRLLLQIESLPTALQSLRWQMLAPPVNASARLLWFRSKIIEILSHFLYRPESEPEPIHDKAGRANRERCERVIHLLERDMENPPSLEMLAGEVGCSPFHLSRLVSRETGMSIPATLRRLRIERAVTLLRQGKGNITEVAIQVGYSSLGAFNKAFSDQMGCSPSAYLKKSSI